MPATTVGLGGQRGNTRRCIALSSQHLGLARRTTPARRADHRCNIYSGATQGRIPTGASGYSDCHVVVFNGMIYMFEAAGKPHQKWSSTSCISHLVYPLAGIVRLRDRASGPDNRHLALLEDVQQRTLPAASKPAARVTVGNVAATGRRLSREHFLLLDNSVQPFGKLKPSTGRYGGQCTVQLHSQERRVWLRTSVAGRYPQYRKKGVQPQFTQVRRL